MFINGDQDREINHPNDETEKLVETTIHSEAGNKMKVLVSWSQLDQDSLGQIMCKLSLLDQARFHAVCKTWQATHSTTISLPWFVTVQSHLVPAYNNPPLHLLFSKPCDDPEKPTKMNEMLKFKTYGPSCHIHPRPPSVFTISLTQLFGLSPSFHRCFNRINPVKYGWFFIITSEYKRKRSRFTRFHLVLFSPLTKKVIKLPSVDYFDCNFVFTFSTNPESPECVFIILGDKNRPLSTFQNGDDDWKYQKCDMFSKSIYPESIPEYVDGKFYILLDDGQLVSYNIVDGKFKYESVLTDSCFSDEIPYSSDKSIVFMLEGELMGLLLRRARHPHRERMSWVPSCLRKFDWTNKVWIPVNDLGDHTLFVWPDTSSVARVGKKATRNNEALSNKLYYFDESGCYLYSVLENGEFVKVKSIRIFLLGAFPRMNSLDIDDNDLLEYMYKSVITVDRVFFKSFKSFFWLEPPVIGA